MENHKEVWQSWVPTSLYGHASAGAALILIGYFLMYLVQFEAILGTWATPFVLMVVVAVMVMVLLTVRQEEGTLKFGRAFGLALLGGWLARLGYNAFNLLLFSVLRPDLKEPYIKLLVETSMEAIELLGVSPSSGGLKDSDLMALFRQEAEKSLTFWGQIRDGMFSLIWVALVALIIAAILQRRSAQQGFSGKA
jgi:hypothetical protein